jgi:hypothetical protein
MRGGGGGGGGGGGDSACDSAVSTAGEEGFKKPRWRWLL